MRSTPSLRSTAARVGEEPAGGDMKCSQNTSKTSAATPGKPISMRHNRNGDSWPRWPRMTRGQCINTPDSHAHALRRGLHGKPRRRAAASPVRNPVVGVDHRRMRHGRMQMRHVQRRRAFADRPEPLVVEEHPLVVPLISAPLNCRVTARSSSSAAAFGSGSDGGRRTGWDAHASAGRWQCARGAPQSRLPSSAARDWRATAPACRCPSISLMRRPVSRSAARRWREADARPGA